MKTFRDISFSYVAVGVLNPVDWSESKGLLVESEIQLVGSEGQPTGSDS